MNNGTRKGGQPDAMKASLNSPVCRICGRCISHCLEARSNTVPGMFIANAYDNQQPAVPVAPITLPPPGTEAPPPPQHNGPAHWIKVSAQTDGAFTITNARNGFSKKY